MRNRFLLFYAGASVRVSGGSAVVTDNELREDGSFVLREDGSFVVREDYFPALKFNDARNSMYL